jgi:hypothetical protein
MIKKDVIITVLTTFCLTATLFTVIPIRSGLPYDPWADLRGPYADPDIPEGTINMRDIGYIASMFMTSGDPTKNVTVTNLPLDEYGNLRVSGFGESLQPCKLSQKMTIFSTEPHYFFETSCYWGGVKLKFRDHTVNSDSGFVFSFNPSGTPFNITSVQVSAIIFADRGSTVTTLEPTRGWITINNQTEQITTDTYVYIGYLTALSIPVSNSTLINSIHEGTNTLQMVIQSYSDYALEWFDDCACELSLFIEYECLA